MGRDKRSLPSAVVGGPKERHRRKQKPQFDPHAPVPQGFVAKPVVPKSKHHTYFEFVENKHKKKKLEFQITTKREPPPGFEFVPIGNPQLTTACKEISRERDAMIFIVSNAKAAEPTHLANQIHRMGHHIRETIVEEAKATLSHFPSSSTNVSNGDPEPIPDSQEEYHAQVDPAIRDLFPRIPNTDREMIIAHSFTRGASLKEEQPVGLCADITLARRVQLAVLAHIRHVHTRYDDLLRETSWQNARKVVESLCLDTLVKWRGDEETGRDQLDEILREVVVISDSEGEDSDAESTDDTSVEEVDTSPDTADGPVPSRAPHPGRAGQVSRPLTSVSATRPMPLPMITTVPTTGQPSSTSRRERNHQRGFKRYRAWEEAIRRHREREMQQSLDVMDIGADTPPMYPGTRPAQLPTASPSMRGIFGNAVPSGARLQHRDEDVPVPSIEPVSPQTMPPSFVRSIPPRIPLEVHSRPRRRGQAYATEMRQELRTSSHYRQAPGEQHPTAGQEMLHYIEVPGRGHELPSQSFHAYSHRQVYQEADELHGSTSARRIIVDAPRPGTRSNPIIMEDRGGFYERVVAPLDSRPDPRPQIPNNTMPAVTVSRMPPLAPSRGEGSRTYQERSLPGLDFNSGNHGSGVVNTFIQSNPGHAYEDSPRHIMVPAFQNRNLDHAQGHSVGHILPPQTHTEFLPPRREVHHGGWETAGSRARYEQMWTYSTRHPDPNAPRQPGSRPPDNGDVIVLE